MTQKRFVLSTVGISLLLNVLRHDESEWRQRLNQEANARKLAPDVAAKVDDLTARALAELRKGNPECNRRPSAELNGVYGLYQNQIEAGRGDVHYLVTTDTLLGRKAGACIETFFREQGLVVDIYTPPSLSTVAPNEFAAGIKALIHWCEKSVPGFEAFDYEVIFNLTGAFKRLQGYLKIIGMFYADEIVYIFETGSQLLTIPRLPLQIDVGILRGHCMELALMAQAHVYTQVEVAGIPAGLLELDDQGHAVLSDWGTFVWNRVRQELLAGELLPFPCLKYSDTFRRDYKQASGLARCDLQQTLARISSLLQSRYSDVSVLKQDGGLQYSVYTNKETSDGRPIGHFRLTQGWRVSCTVEDGLLHLRRYGDHEINLNP